MKTFPTTDEVIAWLRDRDQPAMALAVERLRDAYRDARQCNEHNVAACNALRERYEPTYRSPTYRPPPESNG